MTNLESRLFGFVAWSYAYAYIAIIVPRDDDQDIYLVMDDFGGRLGLAWRETDPDSTDFEIVIRDLLDGQYSNVSVWLDSIPRKAGRGTFPKISPMNSP